MGCGTCCKKDDQKDVFKPYGERWCTDILFIILFLAAWAGTIVLCVVSINKDPSLLTNLQYPTDSYGNNCGHPGTLVAAMPKVVYPVLDQDMIRPDNALALATAQFWNFNPTRVCAVACPSSFLLANAATATYGGYDYGNGTAETYPYFYSTQDIVGRCLPTNNAGPGATKRLCVSPACTSPEAVAVNATCEVIESQPSSGAWAIDAASAPQVAACTLEVEQRVTESFVPSERTDNSQALTESYANYMQTVVGAIDGLLDPYALYGAQIGLGVGLPIGMGFVWAVFLWFFAGVVVYLLLVILVVFLLLADFFFAYKAGWFSSNGLDSAITSITSMYNSSTTIVSVATGTEQTWFTVFAVFGVVLTVLVIICILAWRKCIKRLIAILKECTKVFKAMMCITLWPIISLVFTTGIFVFGLLVTYFIVYVWEEVWQMVLALVLHFLVVAWSMQLVRACTWTSMSAAIAKWFCTENAPGGATDCCGVGLGIKDLGAGTWLVMSKHFGSMCFGSLIIAVVQTVRSVVAYLDYHTQGAQHSNYLLKVTFKCLQCCLTCLQKTIEFISYYGFVFVAMRGEPFCKACFSTFAFVMEYPAQTAVNKTIQKLLKLLIGISTPVLSAVITFYFLEGADGGAYARKYNTIWATGVTFLIAYLVTDAVCSVYDVAIDTIYLCAFKDMKENSPPKFISAELRAGFGIDAADHEASKQGKDITRRLERGWPPIKKPDAGGTTETRA